MNSPSADILHNYHTYTNTYIELSTIYVAALPHDCCHSDASLMKKLIRNSI